MTPKFYTIFFLLQRTLKAFNQKCDCKGSSAIVQFEQVLNTQNTDNDTTIWIARFISDPFANQRFGGTQERVSELLSEYVLTLIEQILESCIANSDDWYKEKPEVVKELYDLHAELVGLGGPV